MIRNTIIALTLTLAAFTSMEASAQDAGRSHHVISDMAKIMLEFDHKASADDVAKLDKILGDSQIPANEKTLAQAIRNIDHTVTAGDKEKLTALANDKSVTAEVREMADILLDVDHHVTDEDKKKLKTLVKISEVSPRH